MRTRLGRMHRHENARPTALTSELLAADLRQHLLLFVLRRCSLHSTHVRSILVRSLSPFQQDTAKRGCLVLSILCNVAAQADKQCSKVLLLGAKRENVPSKKLGLLIAIDAELEQLVLQLVVRLGSDFHQDTAESKIEWNISLSSTFQAHEE